MVHNPLVMGVTVWRVGVRPPGRHRLTEADQAARTARVLIPSRFKYLLPS